MLVLFPLYDRIKQRIRKCRYPVIHRPYSYGIRFCVRINLFNDVFPHQVQFYCTRTITLMKKIDNDWVFLFKDLFRTF